MATNRTRSTDPAASKPKRRSTRSAAASKRPRKAAASAAVGHDAIAVRAYAIFEAEGGGDHLDHWLRAERELAAA